ncbi:hypothetical protein [Paenibacillus daejeonensis]|uniref:hypothetical protein n=1 Tax=Paenibacillus daejeonensis TaxID=135193 RepID=UPI000380CC19|nr:hypothetical protein [Paenibacillus daejeonensis]
MLTPFSDKRLWLVIIIVSVMLVGCSGPNIENQLSAKLLKTEKTLPEDMFGSLIVEVATSEKRMNDLWQRFGLRESIPVVNFAVDDVYFVGMLESGSCELKYAGVGKDEVNQELVIHVTNSNQMCTLDGVPRSYVLAVDKESSIASQKANLIEWYNSKAGKKRESVPIVRN